VDGAGLWRRQSRTNVPKIVDWYMPGNIEIAAMIAYALRLEYIKQALIRCIGREHSERRGFPGMA
jgi:Zn-dependent alcohol dehydrogenase